MLPSDQELLRRACDGDRSALGTLLDARARSLAARVATRLPERFRAQLDAEDVVQETFTDAFLAIDEFEPSGGTPAFDAWLWRLATHNLVDVIRSLEAAKRGGRSLRSEPLVDRDSAYVALGELLLAGSMTTPSMHAMRRENATLVATAITRLPEAHRMVVELYDLAGLPIDEVAKRLQRSVGAVYLLRNRAHRRLRDIL